MLVLSRRIGERICIGDGIVVTVIRINDDKVRLGIEAPKEVPVNRQEVLKRGPKPQPDLPPLEQQS